MSGKEQRMRRRITIEIEGEQAEVFIDAVYDMATRQVCGMRVDGFSICREALTEKLSGKANIQIPSFLREYQLERRSYDGTDNSDALGNRQVRAFGAD